MSRIRSRLPSPHATSKNSKERAKPRHSALSTFSFSAPPLSQQSLNLHPSSRSTYCQLSSLPRADRLPLLTVRILEIHSLLIIVWLHHLISATLSRQTHSARKDDLEFEDPVVPSLNYQSLVRQHHLHLGSANLRSSPHRLERMSSRSGLRS